MARIRYRALSFKCLMKVLAGPMAAKKIDRIDQLVINYFDKPI